MSTTSAKKLNNLLLVFKDIDACLSHFASSTNSIYIFVSLSQISDSYILSQIYFAVFPQSLYNPSLYKFLRFHAVNFSAAFFLWCPVSSFLNYFYLQ